MLNGPDETYVGQVAFHAEVDGQCWSCVTLWTKLPQSNMYEADGTTVMTRSKHIFDTCIYRRDGDVAYVTTARDST